MKQRLPRLWLALGALALGAACAGQIPPPTEADALRASAQFPGTTVAALIRGRSLYIEHCSGCHSLFSPRSQPPAVWPKIVHEMAVRSKLDDATAAELARYLVVASTAPDR
jgi:mono/diheme cytochrome c family protein